MASLADCFQYPGISLAHISEAHIKDTVALINEAYAYQNNYKQAPRTNPEHLRQNAEKHEFYVAKQGHAIVGCVYTKREHNSVHFGLLAVASKLRGKGLGPALIKAVEAYAGSIGAEKVELDYMSAAPWLKAYYERHGYAETGNVRQWGNIDLIRMTKSIK